MGAIASGLGAVLPVLSTGISVYNSVKGLSNKTKSRRSDNQALDQLKQQQKLNEKLQTERNALDKKQIAASAEDSDRKRRNALKRAVARQRAQFGAQGISTANGSGEAILLGLFDESEADLNSRNRLDGLRSSALDQGLSQSKRINVLQATQLAEKQRLKRSIF